MDKITKIGGLVERARDAATEAKAPSTRRAYRTDWEAFTTWADENGAAALPARPDAVAAYVVQLDDVGRAPATIDRVLVSISQAHKLAGHPAPTVSPLVRETLKGIKRRRGTAQKKSAPITVTHLRRMSETCDDSPRGLRDRALLLMGWAGGFRRSELVALDVADVHPVDEGLRITLRRSKTDQQGAGRVLGIPFGKYQNDGGTWPTCPVRALNAWTEAAGIDGGPLFRSVRKGGNVATDRLSARSVDRIVRDLVAAAGYRPLNYSSHSLRSGFATAAAAADVPERRIMDHTGHKSLAQVRDYIREGSIFVKNPLARLL